MSLFTTEKIIDLSEPDHDNNDSTSDQNDITSQLYNICMFLKHKSTEEVYNVFKDVQSQMEDDEYDAIQDKYNISIDSDIESHPEIENIKKDIDDIRLHNAYGYGKHSTKYLHMGPRYSSEEIESIQEIYKMPETVPLVFIRKMYDGTTMICFVRLDDERKMLTMFDVHLKFNIYDEQDIKRKRFAHLLEIMLEELNDDCPMTIYGELWRLLIIIVLLLSTVTQLFNTDTGMTWLFGFLSMVMAVHYFMMK